MPDALFQMVGINGRIRVYTDRVVIQRSGWRAMLFHGRKPDKTIYLKDIVGIKIEYSGALNNGYFQILVEGDDQPCGHLKAIRHENTITVSSKPRNNMAMDYVRKKIMELKGEPINPDPEEEEKESPTKKFIE